MPAWIEFLADVSWRGAIAATPAVMLLTVLVRRVSRQPATRHALWVVALAWFVVATSLCRTDWMLYRIGPPARMNLTADDQSRVIQHSTLQSESVSQHYGLLSNQVENYVDSLHIPAPDHAPPRTGVGPATDSSIPLAQAVCPPSRRRSDSLNSLPRFDSADRAVSPGPHFTVINESASKELIVPTDPTDYYSMISRWRDALGNGLNFFWLTGVAALLLFRLIGVVHFWAGLRRAKQAPPEITRDVEACARGMGLRRPPRVWMVDNRVSPMVWWFGRRYLILPCGLWSRLEMEGRRAILYHELAHLRRWDDRVRWLQFAISVLHWWHPLVWWIDRRIREEAEICCDAWVTWMLPSGRRTYADALLSTSQFVNRNVASRGAGIGVISVRACRMARRLTMVMTNRTQRPTLNGAGLAMAAALAVVAWVATPAWSRPPSAKDRLKQELASKIAAHQENTNTTRAAAPLTDLMRSGVSLLGGVAAVREEPEPREQGRADRRRATEDDVEKRIARLERMIEELAARRGTPPVAAARPVVPRQPRRPDGALARPVAPDQAGLVEGTYRLSKGKLEALVSLMSRSDVPVLINRRDDGIVVLATPEQQEAFRAFVELIEPEAADTSVPRVPRTPRARGIGVTAPRIAPSPPAAPKLPRVLRGAHESQLRRAIEQLHQERDRIEERIEFLNEKAEAMREKADTLKDRPRSDAMHEVDVLNKTAEELNRHLEQLDQQVEEMELLLEQAEVNDESGGAHTPAPEKDARSSHEDRAAELFARRDWSEAAEAFRDVLHEQADDGDAWYQFGYALHMQGQYDEAIAAFQRSTDLNARPSDSLYNIACGYSLKGDVEHALEWLIKAHDAGFQDLDHMRNDSDLKNLRADPRFEKQLAEWTEN